MSRSYYAAHLLAVEKLGDEGIVFDGTAKDHGKAISELKELFRGHPDQLKQRAGKRLQNLWLNRREADYNVSETATEKACKNSMQMATDVIKALN